MYDTWLDRYEACRKELLAVTDQHAVLASRVSELEEALNTARELAEFHEGSQQVIREGGNAVVWINYEDHLRVLNVIRAALKGAK